MLRLALTAAAFAALAPIAHAAGICDQISGTYVDTRTGTLSGASVIAFDRLILRSGTGSDIQLTMASPNSPSAGNTQLRATACTPLNANSARIVFEGALPGKSGYSSAGSAVFTVYDGGARIWIKGDTKGAELPGWLLRVPTGSGG